MVRILLYFSFLVFLFTEPIQAIDNNSTDTLSAFSARIKDKLIYLNWRVNDPRDISYFEIQKHDSKTRLFKTINGDKKVKASDYIEQGLDENNITVYKYNYEDDPEIDGVYYYRIKAYNTGGKLLFTSDELKIGVTGLRDFTLEQNQPNPFNPTTLIKYTLTSNTRVSLKVFDLIGKEVATLVDQIQNEGDYSIMFDASKYPNMTSGIYFYKLETDKYSEVKKMILAK